MKNAALVKLILALAVAGTAFAARPAAAQTRAVHSRCAGAPAYGWLHTSGIWIVDDHDCRVRLESVNWFGMETTNYVPDGLNVEPYTAILQEIRRLGFNSIRLSFSEQMVRDNSKLYARTTAIKANPDLKGLHPLQVLDKLVAAARQNHLLLILDNHGSRASSPVTSSIEPTWNYYTEQGWIDDWVTLARRYRNDPTVTGFDLRNEPHTGPPGPWRLKSYLTQGATWGPYPNGRHPSKLWNPSSDWASAATRCGNALLAVNPHLLMFVEGVQLYPDWTQPGHVFTYWWGSILTGVSKDPIVFRVPDQLVYAPHEWGPRRTKFFWERWDTTYRMVVSIMNENWGFILHSKNPVVRHPVWLGEFNTCNYAMWCVRNSTPGHQGQWWQIFIRFLRANPEISWSYYPINGTNSVGKRSNNSILSESWKAVRLPLLMRDLRTVMGQPTQ